MERERVVGIDLAGSPERDTGYCFLHGNAAAPRILHGDAEILAALARDRPPLVAIDAPLSLPEGRKSIDARDNRHFRRCDLALRKLGIRFFPITLGPMRMLTKRGMALARKIKKLLPRARVIEVYPGASYDVFGIARKNRRGIIGLFRSSGILVPPNLTQDGLDGIACALTGRLVLGKKAIALGSRDGRIFVPKQAAIPKQTNKKRNR